MLNCPSFSGATTTGFLAVAVVVAAAGSGHGFAVFCNASNPGKSGSDVGSLEHEPARVIAQATKLRVRLYLIDSRTITDPQGDNIFLLNWNFSN